MEGSVKRIRTSRKQSFRCVCASKNGSLNKVVSLGQFFPNLAVEQKYWGNILFVFLNRFQIGQKCYQKIKLVI